MKLFILLIMILCACGACTYLNKNLNLPDDHFAEEAAERLIEAHLNLPPGSVDLSP